MENENKELEQSHVVDDASSQDRGAIGSSRRRLLRAGLKTAPIIVSTLASRPSLACHCIVPSAWGSIRVADPVKFDQDIERGTLNGSLIRFEGAIRRNFPAYRFSNFNTSTSGGWTDLKVLLRGKFPEHVTGLDNKISYLQGTFSNFNVNPKVEKLTVEGLCGLLGISVPNGSKASFPLAMIQGNSEQDRFGAAMFIALLNQKLNKLPSDCLISTKNGNVLADMVDGSYNPDGATLTWGKKEIADYLNYNWFANRS